MYENARSHFVAKMKSNMSDHSQGPNAHFPCIDGFTDEPVVQCDVQV